MRKILWFLTHILIFFATISCDKYLDINTDPNNPTAVSPDLVLPVALNATSRYQYQFFFGGANTLGNFLIYNWSEGFGCLCYPDELRYSVTPAFYQRLFDNAYLKALKQYSVLGQFENEIDNYRAIGMIMKVYHFQILVDLYGDIPYFEALARSDNPTPKYDDAQAVYNDLIIQLTSAIDIINLAEGSAAIVVPGSDDIMYGGDMQRWKQFANTLKIRILVRQSDIASKQTYIADEIANIISEGSGFITEDVVINPGYFNEEGKQNPYWAELGANVDGTVTFVSDATVATQFVIDFLTTSNDPRIDYIYEQPLTGHMGVEQGIPTTEAQLSEFVSNIGPGILTGSEQGSIIFTLAEHNFNLAEAAFKGLYLGNTPEILFNAGVAASFTTLSAPGYTTYIGQNSYAAQTDKLEAILTQKWVALNGINALQSWFDYSRTGYPLNLPISVLATTPDRPVRLLYPASEITKNSNNVPPQKDAFIDKIFWAN